jgi:hypothetical protein
MPDAAQPSNTHDAASVEHAAGQPTGDVPRQPWFRARKLGSPPTEPPQRLRGAHGR